jgi:hypothetical protein
VGNERTLAYRAKVHGELSLLIAPLHGKPERAATALDLVNAEYLRLSPDGTTIAAQIPRRVA